MKIICIGDSLTQGFGVLSNETWVNLMNEKSVFDFINKGINGDTSSGMLSRFQKDVIEENPRFVIIMGGVNDLIVENNLGNIQSNMMAMVHQAYYYKIVPILGTNIKMDVESFRKDWSEITDITILNDKISEYRNWIIKFCGIFNVLHIDFYKEFDDRIHSNYSRYLLDGLHPSKEGHLILADIGFDFIKNKGILREGIKR